MGEILIDGLGNLIEFLDFVILTHKVLHHAHAAQVFLHHVVERIVGFEHAAEDGMRAAHDQIHAQAHHRQAQQEHQRNLRVDGQRHYHGEDQRHGRTHGHAHDHLESVLHVGHVRGQTGDDRGGAELIDIGERIILNAVIHIMAQVAREAAGGRGSHFAALYAKEHGQKGRNQ